MANPEPSILVVQEGKVPRQGYTEMRTHIVFDIEMDFTRKAQIIADGSITEVDPNCTYASVVSRASIHIIFLYTALNDLDIMAGDVTAAYLNVQVGEKVYFRCGPEFGSLQGHLAILAKVLYGLKTSARAWRLHLSEVLENQLNYKSCLVDPDIWLSEAGKENHKYYEMLLVYTDDILVISHRAKEALPQKFPCWQVLWFHPEWDTSMQSCTCLHTFIVMSILVLYLIQEILRFHVTPMESTGWGGTLRPRKQFHLMLLNHLEEGSK